MKAMIFAAGLGTRLRPLTDTRPKALVEINGVTLLERAFQHLRSAGVNEIIVNAHHFADQIAAFVRAKDNFGMRVEISFEEVLLDTGGGLKKATWFFDDEQPFFVHNADVISSLDLMRMYHFHLEQRALATLAVKPRTTKRYLVFDKEGRLCGRREDNSPLEGGQGGVNAADEINRSLSSTHLDLAFDGIHVISPQLLGMMKEAGVFSILKTYLRLASEGQKILAFRTDEYYWRDVGKLEQLQQIAAELTAQEETNHHPSPVIQEESFSAHPLLPVRKRIPPE